MSDVVIKSASYEIIPVLARIWRMCFGDTEEYINMFMHYRFKPEATIVAVAGGVTVGSAYILPCGQAGSRGANYIYAVGVLPEYRGNGVFNKIMNEALRRSSVDGRDIMLVPAKELEKYYVKKGLSGTYQRIEYEINVEKEYNVDKSVEKPYADEIERTTLIPDVCKAERDRYFTSTGSAVWDKEAIDYALREKRYCGGICDEITICGKKRGWYIIADIIDGILDIEETTIPYGNMTGSNGRLARRIAAMYGTDHIHAWFVIPENEERGCREYALTTNTGIAKNAWLGLTLI